MTDKPYLNPQYVTKDDAALACGVTTQTITRWIREGQLTAQKFPNGHVYVHRDSLPESVMITLGARLRYARRVKRLKAVTAAAHIGVDRFVFSKYEHDTRPIKPEHLSKLARLYGVSVKWLETGHD